MKIISLHLSGFQSHTDTTVQFTDGLNVIVGASNVGKSSLLRALRKIIRDSPSGKVFINDSCTEMTLTLTFIDSSNTTRIIIRRVTPSKNIYTLDAQEFGGFGKEIPAEITAALAMPSTELEDGTSLDLYFSDQHDRPFLISETASVRSKLLGNVAGLFVLDRAIIDASKDKRSVVSECDTVRQSVLQLQSEYDSLPVTEPTEKLLDNVDATLVKVKETETLKMSLKELLSTYNQIITEGKSLRTKYEQIPTIDVDFTAIRKQVSSLLFLKELQERYESVSHSLVQIEEKYTKLVDVSFDKEKIQGQINQLVVLQEHAQKLRRIYEDSSIIEESLRLLPSQINVLENEWKLAIQNMKICPTCKQSTRMIGENDAK